MKSICLIFGIAALTALSSCSIKEELVQQERSYPSFYGTMETAIQDGATKAYVDESYYGYWNKNDKLSIFYGNTYNKQYKYVGSSGTTSGHFDPAEGTDDINAGVDIVNGLNYAIYPYNDYNACQEADGMLIVPFPKERTITSISDGIGASIMVVAKSETKKLPFKHVAGYLGFQLYGANVSVASITLTSNGGEPFSGSANVVYGDDDKLQVSFVDRDHEDDPGCTFIYDPPIALNASADAAKIFWITLPPAVLSSGLTLTVKDADGGVWEKTSNYGEIKVNVFHRFNAMEVIPKIPMVNVTSVSISSTTLNLNVDDEATLTATVLPENATDKSVTWTSSNTNVATVDENGKVTAMAAGEADITATSVADNTKTATCTVTVKNAVSYRVTISSIENDNSVDIGTPKKVFALTLFTTTNDVENGGELVTSGITWSVSDADAEYAEIAEDGTITGKKETKDGPITVTAMYTDPDEVEWTLTAPLTVNMDPNHPGNPTPIEEENL